MMRIIQKSNGLAVRRIHPINLN